MYFFTSIIDKCTLSFLVRKTIYLYIYRLIDQTIDSSVCPSVCPDRPTDEDDNGTMTTVTTWHIRLCRPAYGILHGLKGDTRLLLTKQHGDVCEEDIHIMHHERCMTFPKSCASKIMVKVPALPATKLSCDPPRWLLGIGIALRSRRSRQSPFRWGENARTPVYRCIACTLMNTGCPKLILRPPLRRS